jgi:Flp pilus assembly protein TadB
MIPLLGSPRSLGQLEWLPTVISAGLQAGAAGYGAYMQQSIAKLNVRTQKEIQEKQAAAAQAAADAQAKAAQQQVQQQQIQAATGAGTILGIDRDIFIVGGVGVAVMLGVVAFVASRKSRVSVASPENSERAA